MLFKHIHHVAIIVSNHDVALDFYVGKLGFKIIRDNYRPSRDDWKTDLDAGDGIELELFSENNPPMRVNRPEARGLRHLAFRVEDIDAAVRELSDLGIVCENIRTDEYTNKRMTFFFDPDGLPLEIHE